MNGDILIACVGNIFFGDDGFGFEIAQALARCKLPPGTEVRDYGIRGLDLAYALLCPWKAVILVDAIACGDAPGTLYLLQPEQGSTATLDRSADPHSVDPTRVLAMARSLGEVRAAIYLIGCEPADFGLSMEGRIGLSPVVAEAVPKAVKMIQQLTGRLTQVSAA